MPEARDLFAAVFFAGMGIAAVIRWRYTRHHRAMVIAERRREPGVYVLMALWGLAELLPFAATFTSWLRFADYTLPLPVGLMGTLILAAGLWLLWRAHADLGPNWTPSLIIRDGHTLVTGGIYRSVRHPMYTAHWLWAVAQGLLIQNWIAGLAGLAVFAPLYVLRVGPEEAQLRAHFGEAYRAYEKRTGRLWPKLKR